MGTIRAWLSSGCHAGYPHFPTAVLPPLLQPVSQLSVGFPLRDFRGNGDEWLRAGRASHARARRSPPIDALCASGHGRVGGRRRGRVRMAALASRHLCHAASLDRGRRSDYRLGLRCPGLGHISGARYRARDGCRHCRACALPGGLPGRDISHARHSRSRARLALRPRRGRPHAACRSRRADPNALFRKPCTRFAECYLSTRDTGLAAPGPRRDLLAQPGARRCSSPASHLPWSRR